MQTLTLDSEAIMKLTAEPTLYSQFPFLDRLKNPALSTHLKLQKMSCTGCSKKARLIVAMQIAAAFLQLISLESKKTPNDLFKLKQFMAKILGQQFDKVRAIVRLANGQVMELSF